MASIPASQDSYTDNSFELTKLELVSNSGGDPIDITNLFIEIAIYESVFDTKIVGEVLFKDALNLSEALPIIGNEMIYIEYKTKGIKNKPVSIVGNVVAPMGKGRADGEKVEIYKIQFVSNTQFANRFRRVATTYSGNIAAMVTQIFKENFVAANSGRLYFNDLPQGNHKFTIPYWSPLFTASWLAERAYANKPSCFVFYEDVDGFHFKNLLKAVELDPVMTYNVEPMNGANMGDVNAYLSKVKGYSNTSFFDRLEEQAGGMYAGSLLTHDITTKKYESHVFDYREHFARSSHLNKYPLFPENSKMTKTMMESGVAFRNVVPIQRNKFENIEDNEKPDRYLLDRRSIQKQFRTMRVTISVPGISTLRLLDTVYYRIPKSGYLDEYRTDWEDQYLSGKYIVMSLTTVINKLDGYKTIIEMSKDSLIKGIPDSFEKSSNNVL